MSAEADKFGKADVHGKLVWAHSKFGRSVEKWQSLEHHMQQVSLLAGLFAASFNSRGWGELIGILHDLGKARDSFQNYLLLSNGIETDGDISEHSHSGAGAVWAANALKGAGRFVAYCIAGHHAGLPDWLEGETPNGSLKLRLHDDQAVLCEQSVAEWIAAHEAKWKGFTLAAPWGRFSDSDTSVSFWVRLLYSCLVDADFLDTERFMDESRAAQRGAYPTLSELGERFFAWMDAFQESSQKTFVNAVRASVRVACETAATLPTGLFSLSVPTGGGKTLSSMAFAFRHAAAHDLQRIIYVIPYTSIIEQTAEVLRGILGECSVVEHHSNLDPSRESPIARLATENWDAPIVVTTSVQFFESLYACKSSRCRKLHNLAKSVVILDEVQLLPPELLWPCTEALRQLTLHYGTTVLLSTATQPALEVAGPLSDIPVHRIISDERSLYQRLKRVEIEMPHDLNARRDWDSLAAELRTHPQVLCIVNGKRDCRELCERLPAEATFYLTTNLCGADRSARIAEIKRRLRENEPVRVISTQLIEAGVDVDFPIVYRAYAGYSSIVQAAGRCNREGRREHLGRVVVFMPPEPSRVASLRKAEDAMTSLASSEDVSFDDPNMSKRFFEAYYARRNDDGQTRFREWLVSRSCQFQFREAAAAFRMIADDTIPVVVRYGARADELLGQYRAVGHPTRDVMRALQRYVVNVYRSALPSLLEKGFVVELPPVGSGVFAQTDPSLYSARFGFDFDREGLSADYCIV